MGFTNARRATRIAVGRASLLAIAASAAAGMALAGIAGCGPSGPTEQELRAALVEEIQKDDREYNQRMDRWGPPKPEIDGSSFSMTRSGRQLAVPASEIEIRETGGRTTVYEADVPREIETYIKTGLNYDECLAAPERKLDPQQVTDKYEYDVVRKKWHEVKFEGPGGLLGM
ncbi:MAG: hypothetical protein JSV65_09255 [Armatimonadota bacterium]|nr:MAG: hypothetical protein JSV65_09255 [Armatimonadota bacterium]